MKNLSVILAASLLLLLLLPALAPDKPVRAQEAATSPDQYRFKVLGLIFRVEDMGGKVQDLEVRELGNEIRIEMASDVLFDFDKADLLPKAASTLKQVAAIIRDKAKSVVRIEGHTDSIGSDVYNQKLSERRANSVKAWLVDHEGFTNVQFSTQGFGAKKPVAPNKKPDGSDDPEGRQKNRRVEIILKK